MSEVKFTKGEWVIRNIDGQFAIMRHDTGYGICSTVMQDDTDKANAHLIAAAPAMYEFIEMVAAGKGADLKALQYMAVTWARNAEKLLAKARGE